ncbi:hypothetical protein N7492_010634 [Penicillium capsulatum]|uniref:Autophagy-related protein 16 domain-containing protein n=1 Tax=Penicillium capsulatum TaxID=69766 RepID=A0A9W9HRT2_9EURO|nr:hypothetical protein N7492_010634 [Penicillium capsulatum]KAJ6113133.1 hypothetical protein N7512_008457 [Penicillium capsulatum]
MAHWREEYLAALGARDQREKANVALYDAYTRLADRTAAQGNTSIPLITKLPEGKDAQRSSPSTTIPKKQVSSETDSSLTELLNATRAELSEAQRSRSEIQEKLRRVVAEVEKLRKKNTHDARRIKVIDDERVNLQMRLKDREEELKGKAKLLEDFQDEMATLNLQLNMADEKSNKLQRENKELVDRWMTRMGQEADAMNNASRFS